MIIKPSGVTMILLNIVTLAYFSSMILMAFWTNIRPFYINNWNETEVTEDAADTDIAELGDVDILMIINLVVIAIVGKRNSINTNRYL